MIEHDPDILGLKHFRAYFKLTQAQLAHSSGVSIRTISEIEKNLPDHKTSNPTKKKLCKALGLRFQDRWKIWGLDQ